ncbi:MAG: c-type cytochrome [Gemmatimonadales bacterium]|jgi:mono/diheme cytochrome c family protein
MSADVRFGTSPGRILLGIVGLAVVLAGPWSRAAIAQDTTTVSFTDTIPAATLAQMIDAGADVFNDGTCVACHGVGGRGTRQRAPDLTDDEWLHSQGRYEGIIRTIFWGVKREEMKAVTPRPFQMNPKGGMTMTTEEFRAVAAYVWSLSRAEATPRVEAQGEFLDLLADGRVDEAKALFERESRDAPGALLFRERALNSLGYEFLRQRSEPRTAIAIFELNAERHPESWNVWDSLAEGHMAAGDRQAAIDMYEKSLEINPDNTNASNKLTELRRG